MSKHRPPLESEGSREDRSAIDAADALRSAKEAYGRGDWGVAASVLEAAVSGGAADATILHNLGLVREELGDYLGAVEAYTQSLEEIPDGYVNRGFCYEMLGRNADARRDYLTALRADPDDVAALVNLGTLELEEGQILAAEEILLRARHLDPTANWQLSDVYVAKRDYVAAVAALQIAVANGETRAIAALRELRSSLR